MSGHTVYNIFTFLYQNYTLAGHDNIYSCYKDVNQMCQMGSARL